MTEPSASAQKLALGSMGAVAVAAFLPWVSLFGISKTGIEGDGAITLGFALLGLLLHALSTSFMGAPRIGRKGVLIASLVLGALTALTGLADMSNVAAFGLYLTLFGGIAWVVAGIWEFNVRKSSAVPTSSADQPTTEAN